MYVCVFKCTSYSNVYCAQLKKKRNKVKLPNEENPSTYLKNRRLHFECTVCFLIYKPIALVISGLVYFESEMQFTLKPWHIIDTFYIKSELPWIKLEEKKKIKWQNASCVRPWELLI